MYLVDFNHNNLNEKLKGVLPGNEKYFAEINILCRPLYMYL